VISAVLCAALTGARAQHLEELPLPEPVQEVPAPGDELDAVEPPEATGVGNTEIEEMVAAGFSDATIVAVINANAVAFDVSPRALVALKSAGVSEPVIEAMLAAEAAKSTAQPEPTSAELAETQASLEYARLTEMIEQLAKQQEAAEKARRAPDPPASRADPSPRRSRKLHSRAAAAGAASA
jgi:hypothetical protein